MVVGAEDDDMHIEYHRQCAFMCYLLFLAGTSMFVDTSESYVDVAYLKYLIDLRTVQEYNLEASVWSRCTRSWAKLVFGK